MSNSGAAGRSSLDEVRSQGAVSAPLVNVSKVAYVKKLTNSDACTSKQIKLPRKEAETFLPAALTDKQSMELTMKDEEDRVWTFQCTRYNFQYALSKIGAFAQAHNLAQDIYLIFYFDSAGALRVACRRTLPSTLNDGLQVEKPEPSSTGRPAHGRGKPAGRPPRGADSSAAADDAAAAQAAAAAPVSPAPAPEPAAAATPVSPAPTPEPAAAAAPRMSAMQGMLPYHSLGMGQRGFGLPMHGVSMPMYLPSMPGWGMGWAPAQHGQPPSSGRGWAWQAAGPSGVDQSPGFISPSPRRPRGPSAFHVPPSSQGCLGQGQQQQAASPQLPPSSQPCKRNSLAAEMDKENVSPVNTAKAQAVEKPTQLKPSPRPQPSAQPDGQPASPLSLWVGAPGRLHPARTPMQQLASPAATRARAAALSMSAQPLVGLQQHQQHQQAHTPFQTIPLVAMNALSEPHAAPVPRQLSPWEAARQLVAAEEPAAGQLLSSDSEGGNSEDARTAAAETLTLLSSGLDPNSRERRKTAAQPKPATARTGDCDPGPGPSRRPSSSRPSDRARCPPPDAEQEDVLGHRSGWQPPCSPRDIFAGLEQEPRTAPGAGAEAPPSAARRQATPRAALPPCRPLDLHQPPLCSPPPLFQQLYPHLLMAHHESMQHAWRQAQLDRGLYGFMPGMHGPIPHLPRGQAGLYWSPGGIGTQARAARQQQQQQAAAGHDGVSHVHEAAGCARNV